MDWLAVDPEGPCMGSPAPLGAPPVVPLFGPPPCARGGDLVAPLEAFRLGAFTFCHWPFPAKRCHCPSTRRKTCTFVLPPEGLPGVDLVAEGEAIDAVLLEDGAAPLARTGDSCPWANPRLCPAVVAWTGS